MDNLYRSSDEKVIAGVCAGLAHRFDWNLTGMRWILVLVSLFFTGLPILVYLVLWIVLKPRPTAGIVEG